MALTTPEKPWTHRQLCRFRESDKDESQATRTDAYLDQVRRVVHEHHLQHLRYVITDGYYSKRKFLDGVRALGMHQIGKLRHDANLRYLYQGPGRPGPRRPKSYDGKVQWDDLSRFECVTAKTMGSIIKSSTTFGAICVSSWWWTPAAKGEPLFSTDTCAGVRIYKARFQRFLFRDAKQFTSLGGSQARSQAKLHVHFNASMSALTLGKLEARQQSAGSQTGFSMASVKRRAFNQHLLERISQHLAQGHSLEKSSPGYVTMARLPTWRPEFCPKYCPWAKC